MSGKPWTFRQIVQGLDRQLPRPRQRVALAAQRRGAHPRARPPVEEPRPRAHRAVASARHGVQRAEQPGADEHAGLRGRLAAALPAGRHALERAGGDLRGHAEREGDPRGPLERSPVRGGEEGEEARVQDRQAAGAVADAARAASQHPRALRPRHRGRRAGARPRRHHHPLGRSTTTTPSRAPAAASTSTSRSSRRRGRPSSSRSSSSRLEGLIGVPAAPSRSRCSTRRGTPAGTSPAIAWVLRRRLLGTNVGRWDYLGSLIEMWKDDPQGRLPGSADDRDGHPEHDRLPALQRAADAHGRHEERRAQPRRAHRRHGGGDDLPAERSLRPLPVQPARAPRDRRSTSCASACWGSCSCPRRRCRRAAQPDTGGHPRRPGEGTALRRLPAELGGEPGDRTTWPRATHRCAPPRASCRRSSTRRARRWT